MNKIFWGTVIVVGFLIVLTLRITAQNGVETGTVYVMTNQVENAVMVFTRTANGSLQQAGTFPTGGAGNPIPMGMDPPTDPLASQGSLVLSGDLLFAVNAGSNEISVLRASGNGLTFVQKVASGGDRPISLTAHDDLLYVLNEGGTPNITGFTINANGTLSPLAGSTRSLVGGAGADPAQVGFKLDGTLLAVTEKMGNRIDTYTVDSNGLPGVPIANPSSGTTPFGFAFDSRGQLFVSEAFGGMPNLSAVSSYGTSSANGVLNLISPSVRNNQTASCWVVLANNERFVFVSNTASANISSYLNQPRRGLLLFSGVAADTGPDSAPIDMAVSGNNLYVLENGDHVVGAFRIAGGNLIPIGEFGSLPAGSQGIAAR